MKLLAIETSCDETAAAVLSYEDGLLRVLGEAVSSQISLHAQFGGVVPNLAAREHVRNIVPIVSAALAEAKLSPNELDGIAVTQGPGLIPALLIGATAAKTLALAWDKPLIGINHLEGHIYANFVGQKFVDGSLKLEKTKGARAYSDVQNPSSIINHRSSIFPLLALIVSGGHTQLVLMRDHFTYELLGETEDDAAGEAFDKVAKMLSLPYPGGPVVAKKADTFRNQNEEFRMTNFDSNPNVSNSKLEHSDIQSEFENRKSTLFPRPMLESGDYRFSFSGLKTAVLYFLKAHSAELSDESFQGSVCHAFQEAVVDVLVAKTERAIQEFSPQTLVIAGGVSANVRLRERIEHMVVNYPGCTFRMPEFKYSLDNAVMIGAAGLLRLARMNPDERAALKVNALTLEPSAHFPLATV